ncbi:uncharacterized protein F4807DRAFT_23772 [Annulohypoxylon truncatum]|uniref:uncharacterized protein n=1 Tax=Annulohypoxylon truncatum TaxID=327061 RepID=UPI0020082B10|nr:uncharacterized protein F4807DRAFT_23772 [Annulohypoxylon truncatum]KAI1215160.1 hypothetical protein F4807DRAFT_23772 [Annulohypoxylon truncatum]
MEVLGAVAAAGQLAGTTITILDSISQIRDFLQHAPARYQGWRDELSALSDTISCIRDNKALHTCQVCRIIEGMAPKITRLKELCAHYTPGPKLKLISRLNQARKARVVECRILQNFQSLEHDKTTLILTINALSHKVSAGNHEDDNPNMSNPNGNGRPFWDTTSVPGTPSSGTNNGASGPLVVNGYNHNHPHAHAQPQNHMHNTPWPNNSPHSSPQFGMPPQQSDKVEFDGVKTEGNGQAVGINGVYTSPNRPLAATFKNLDTSGYNNSVGISSSDVIAGARVPSGFAPAAQNSFNPQSNGGFGGT